MALHYIITSPAAVILPLGYCRPQSDHGSNNIDIGNVGVAGESSTIRIGTAGTQTATYIAGMRGASYHGTSAWESALPPMGNWV